MNFSINSECRQYASELKILESDIPYFVRKKDVLMAEVDIKVLETCPEAEMQIFKRDRGNTAKSWSESTINLLPHEMRAIGRALIAAAEFMEGRPDVA